MVGNDIVDLAAASLDSRICRRGFREKLFTADEIASISIADDPQAMLWRFWTMKEAAYKIYNRQSSRRFYAPKSFRCEIISGGQGIIRFDELKFFSATVIDHCSVYTVAVTETVHFQQIKHCKPHEIVKIDGMPHHINGEVASTTGHGRFRRSVYLIDSEP